MLVVPIVMIVTSIPMILEWVPRNGLYGFRTPRTLASDHVWYPANRVAGIAIACAGSVWLAAAYVVPRVMADAGARPWVLGIGLGALCVAAIVSFVYLAVISPR